MVERPGLAEALARCLEYGAGVLLVEERTHLARDEYAAHDVLRTFAHAGVRVLYGWLERKRCQRSCGDVARWHRTCCGGV